LMEAADGYMEASDLDNATRIFQRMLELDPENASMQAKLADLYVRTGKRDAAKQIFLNAAQSLYPRGALDQADDLLRKALELEAGNAIAVPLRGQIAGDHGRATDAV